MTNLASASIRYTLGYWLYRHRKWGVIPLLAAGLLMNFRYLPVRSGNYMLIAGAIGIFFGTLLRIVCFTFAGPKDPLRSPRSLALVTDGPYAITRNPVYMAEAAIALGIAMMSRMPWLVLVTAAVGGLTTALMIDWEESTLRTRFGEAYDHYRATVPRWFSFRRLFHPESYIKTRGRVKLLTAVRAESLTLLVGLLAILAFLAKANLELFIWTF